MEEKTKEEWKHPREKETKEESFRRVMLKRIKRFDNILHLMDNLSHTGNYAWTKKDIENLFGHIKRQIDALEMKFLKIGLIKFEWENDDTEN